MKTINFVIVKLEEAYDNKEKFSDGTELIVNTTIESVEHIKRVAKVVTAPSFTVLEKGDEVVAHHNIFRLRNGVGGEVVKSNFHLKDDLYFVPLTEIFMSRKDGEDWKALDPFCFVEPLDAGENKEDDFYLSVEESTHKGMMKRRGRLKYPNKSMTEKGMKAGDEVIFREYSEYEFRIDGRLYYKMTTKDILATV